MTSKEWNEKWGSQEEAIEKDPPVYDKKGRLVHIPEWEYDRMF